MQAAREMRLAEVGSKSARTPIIAVTASAVKGDCERFLDAGMDDYLSKPFSFNDLKQVVALWSHGDGCVPSEVVGGEPVEAMEAPPIVRSPSR